MAVNFSNSNEPKFTRNKLEGTDGGAAWQAFCDWRRPQPWGTYNFGTGPLPVEFFPKALQFVKGKKLFDFNGWTDSFYAVSERLRDLIEAMEPGVHQFTPVDVFYKDGTACDQKLYFFLVCTKIDAVTDALGGVYKSGSTEGIASGEYSWTIKSMGNAFLAVRKDVIAGRAAWYDIRYRNIFFSDALLAQMRALKMEGWSEDNYWAEI